MYPAIYYIFSAVLGIFALLATFVAAYSAQNRLRLRSVRISWRAGKLFGLPLFSSIFLGIGLMVLARSFFIETPYFRHILLYNWLGVMWFLAEYIASKHFITNNGIVKNINEPGQTVPWYKIVDFAEKATPKGTEYSFMYQYERQHQKVAEIYTLRLIVPHHKSKEFKKLLHYKLYNRIGELASREPVDK